MTKKKTETKPQATLNTDTQILWFDDLGTDNDMAFLSNFYEGEPLTLPGVSWSRTGQKVQFLTGEHAFAALKACNKDDFIAIVNARSPSAAKALGRKITLRPDWEEVKYDAMAGIIRAKFTRERAEGKMLLETGEKYLAEGTFWHDTVWGVDLASGMLRGRNWLGTLLMARRAEMRAECNGATILSTATWNLMYARY